MIENRYKYGIVYNLDGQIVGFNLSPNVFVLLTDDEIERALETYVIGKLQIMYHEDKMKVLDKISEEITKLSTYIIQNGDPILLVNLSEAYLKSSISTERTGNDKRRKAKSHRCSKNISTSYGCNAGRI